MPVGRNHSVLRASTAAVFDGARSTIGVQLVAPDFGPVEQRHDGERGVARLHAHAPLGGIDLFRGRASVLQIPAPSPLQVDRLGGSDAVLPQARQRNAGEQYETDGTSHDGPPWGC